MAGRRSFEHQGWWCLCNFKDFPGKIMQDYPIKIQFKDVQQDLNWDHNMLCCDDREEEEDGLRITLRAVV